MVDKQTLHVGYNEVWKYAINRLGYEIYEDPDYQDCCRNDAKIIEICSRNGIENKLYALLHECGHALIRENWKKFTQEYPAHADCGFDGRKSRSAKFKISTIEEEIEAWKRGKRLAKRLGIEINEERYDANKAKYLMSYVLWAAG